MSKHSTRSVVIVALSALLMGAMGQASARNLSYSAGKGVKCSYILVSSVNGVNVWQTVCRKSGV
ncbi:MAG: hypothetical protein RJA09_157 [Pseudomonadota bacterium]|jgi:hypothetical protein